MSKQISLTQGKFTIVDDEDYARLNQYKWCALKGGSTYYAVRYIKQPNGKWTALLMHREILAILHGTFHTDHINHNGLDNRKRNLRLVTVAGNQWNQKTKQNCSSRFKGVSWHKTKKGWMVAIRINGKRYYLGKYKTEQEAADVYVNAEKELRGIVQKYK